MADWNKKNECNVKSFARVFLCDLKKKICRFHPTYEISLLRTSCYGVDRKEKPWQFLLDQGGQGTM